MKGLAFSSLRVGKKYRMINYGESHDFILEKILTNGEFAVKDLFTLEKYTIQDLIKFGKGKDFEIRELS